MSWRSLSFLDPTSSGFRWAATGTQGEQGGATGSGTLGAACASTGTDIIGT
jgi:hypothetical protein